MMDFNEILYQKIKSIISTWSEPDIYAISFFVYSNEGYKYNGYSNISTFAISYNTEKDCNGADKYDEERWNYAFWRQNEEPIIDPDVDGSLISQLFDWYREKGIENIGLEDTGNCYDENSNYIGRGPVGHYELLEVVSDVAKRLQTEGFIESRFNGRLPIIIHGLEYAWYDIEATKRANPDGQADEFLDAMKELGFVAPD